MTYDNKVTKKNESIQKRINLVIPMIVYEKWKEYTPLLNKSSLTSLIRDSVEHNISKYENKEEINSSVSTDFNILNETVNKNLSKYEERLHTLENGVNRIYDALAEMKSSINELGIKIPAIIQHLLFEKESSANSIITFDLSNEILAILKLETNLSAINISEQLEQKGVDISIIQVTNELHKLIIEDKVVLNEENNTWRTAI